MDAWMLSAEARQLVAQRLYGPKAQGFQSLIGRAQTPSLAAEVAFSGKGFNPS